MLAVETYAFLKGQSAALKKVALQFPSLKEDVRKLQNSSKVIFGRAGRNIEHFLAGELGGAEFKSLQRRIDSLLNERLKHPIQKEEYARDFLEKVKLKIHLKESGEIQKAIISFAYHDAPHEEITDGHIINFSTKNHPKAEKSAITLSLPKSWSAAEAEMPTTVQQFTSYGGRGAEKILVVVHDLSEEKQKFVLNEKSVAEIIPAQSSLIRTEPVTIDGMPGIMAEVEEILDSSNPKTKIRMLQFMFAHNEKLYCLQGSIGPVGAEHNLELHIKKYEPLFRLIAAHTQIAD